jgi:ribosomal protein S16
MSGVFPYADLARRLPHLLTVGRQEAARYNRATLVSVTVAIAPVEPAVLFSWTQSYERILWEQPSQESSMVAFGATARLVSHGAQRFSQISAGWRGLVLRTLVDAAPSCPLTRPVSLVGYYDPTKNPAVVEFKKDRLAHWLQHGAQPTDTVAQLIKKVGRESVV